MLLKGMRYGEFEVREYIFSFLCVFLLSVNGLRNDAFHSPLFRGSNLLECFVIGILIGGG